MRGESTLLTGADWPQKRHCEERNDEAIQIRFTKLDCFTEPVIGPATSGRTRWLAMTRRRHDAYAGIGKTAFALANSGGRIALMSLSSTCVLTGAAPWFWPLTNLVGP